MLIPSISKDPVRNEPDNSRQSFLSKTKNLVTCKKGLVQEWWHVLIYEPEALEMEETLALCHCSIAPPKTLHLFQI